MAKDTKNDEKNFPTSMVEERIEEIPEPQKGDDILPELPADKEKLKAKATEIIEKEKELPISSGSDKEELPPTGDDILPPAPPVDKRKIPKLKKEFRNNLISGEKEVINISGPPVDEIEKENEEELPPPVEEENEEELPPPPPIEENESSGGNIKIIQGAAIILTILGIVLGFMIAYPLGEAEGKKNSTASSMEKTAQEAWESSQEMKKAAKIIQTASKQFPQIANEVKDIKKGLTAINKNIITTIKKVGKESKKIRNEQKKIINKIDNLKIPVAMATEKACSIPKSKKVQRKFKRKEEPWRLTIVDEDGTKTVKTYYDDGSTKIKVYKE